MGFPTTDQCPWKYKIEDRRKEKDKTHLNQAMVVLYVCSCYDLWSADSAGWTGLKRPCIVWLAQRRACNNVTNPRSNLLWTALTISRSTSGDPRSLYKQQNWLYRLSAMMFSSTAVLQWLILVISIPTYRCETGTFLFFVLKEVHHENYVDYKV